MANFVSTSTSKGAGKASPQSSKREVSPSQQTEKKIDFDPSKWDFEKIRKNLDPGDPYKGAYQAALSIGQQSGADREEDLMNIGDEILPYLLDMNSEKNRGMTMRRIRDQDRSPLAIGVDVVGDALDTVNSGIGGVIDWVADNPIAGIAGVFGGEDAANSVRNFATKDDVGGFLSAAEDMGLWALGPVGLALAAGKSALDNRDNIERAVSGVDPLTLEEVDTGQRAVSGGATALDLALSTLPGAKIGKGLLKQAGKSAGLEASDILAKEGTEVARLSKEADEALINEAKNRGITIPEGEMTDEIRQKLTNDITENATNAATEAFGKKKLKSVKNLEQAGQAVETAQKEAKQADKAFRKADKGSKKKISAAEKKYEQAQENLEKKRDIYTKTSITKPEYWEREKNWQDAADKVKEAEAELNSLTQSINEAKAAKIAADEKLAAAIADKEKAEGVVAKRRQGAVDKAVENAMKENAALRDEMAKVSEEAGARSNEILDRKNLFEEAAANNTGGLMSRLSTWTPVKDAKAFLGIGENAGKATGEEAAAEAANAAAEAAETAGRTSEDVFRQARDYMASRYPGRKSRLGVRLRGGTREELDAEAARNALSGPEIEKLTTAFNKATEEGKVEEAAKYANKISKMVGGKTKAEDLQAVLGEQNPLAAAFNRARYNARAEGTTLPRRLATDSAWGLARGGAGYVDSALQLAAQMGTDPSTALQDYAAMIGSGDISPMLVMAAMAPGPKRYANRLLGTTRIGKKEYGLPYNAARLNILNQMQKYDPTISTAIPTPETIEWLQNPPATSPQDVVQQGLDTIEEAKKGA